MRNFVLILLILVPGIFALNANAAKIPPGYLVGVWSLEGKGKCKTDGFEYVEFLEDGTYKSGRLGTIELVGFWRMHSSDDDIDIHAVTSLAFFGEEFSEYEGVFSYMNMSAVPTSVEKNEFKGVASFGDDLERFTASRCKK